MVYEWKSAARIKTDAQTAGEFCEKLEKEGGLTAKRLVDASRDENAPLHREFEWRDDVAAEMYREIQARHIINCLVIRNEEKPSESVRAFFALPSTDNYQNIQVIFSDAEKKTALLDLALKELKAFQTKYSTLSQLQLVFDAISEVTNDTI